MSDERFTPRSRRHEGGDEYRLPPALARLPADRGRLKREFVERNQRDRILLAALTVFGTEGVASVTVKDLTVEASVSRATFYRFFSGKEECLLALEEELLDWLEEQSRDAASEGEDWPGAVIAVTRRLVELFEGDVRLARLCGIELMMGGPEARSRLDVAFDRLAAGLRLGRAARPWGADLPQLLEDLLVRGVATFASAQIAFGTEPAGRDLANDLPEVVLVPYLGAEDALRAVRSFRPRR